MTARAWFVAALLLLSGMCALIFQVAWLREFRLVFGGSTTASAAVLAVFMGGLGFGNLLLGRFANQYREPLRLYALLELGIALACALSPLAIDAMRYLYAGLGGQEVLGVAGATAVRLLMTALVLGVPTLLMGGTLPAAAKAVTNASDEQRRDIGLIYGMNALGAVIGALATTFFLLQTFGTRRTLWLACLVNVGLALVAWQASRSAARPVSVGRKEERKRVTRDAAELAGPAIPTPTPIAAPWVYGAALLVGAAFFLMELVWYRLLTPLLGGSTYTFGLILAIALTGIGVGGALYSWIFRRSGPTARTFAATCGLQAACMALPFALGDRLALWAADLYAGHSTFGGMVFVWTIIAGIVVFPAALVSGVQFPVLIALLGRGDENIAKQVGTAFAWNTVGCILGSLLGGFGLMSLLGAIGVWCLVVILLSLLALAWSALAYRRHNRLWPLWAPVLSAAAALVMLSFTGPTAIWRHSAIGAGRSRFAQVDANERQRLVNHTRRGMLWETDGVESSVAIFSTDSFAFFINGKSDGNALGDAGTQIMLGMVGAAVHPNPKAALVVGLGTGETAGWLASVADIERVDVVELEPAVVTMAQLCAPVNRQALDNPKLRLIINDAREVLTTTPQTYDLIVSEPSNPYRAGVAGLFTEEFYRSVRQRLNKDGIFCQWVQAYEIDMRTLGIVVNTLQRQFGAVEIWETQDGDLMLLASTKSLVYDVPRMRARLAEEPFCSALKIAWRAGDLEGLLAGFIGNDRLAEKLAEAAEGEVNTDDRNVLEYAFARSVGAKEYVDKFALRAMAASLNAHRPDLAGGSFDRETVLDIIAQSYVHNDKAIPDFPVVTTAQMRRFEALDAHQRHDHALALTKWYEQERAPKFSTELAVIAYSMVLTDDPRAEATIESLRALEPIEADGLLAIRAARRRDFDTSANLAERALLGLRSNPFPRFAGHLCKLALQLAEQDKRYAAQLYPAVAMPFAVAARQEQREATALLLAEMIGGDKLLAHLESYEPHVLWSESFLLMRAQAYATAQHPLQGRARRQLAMFQASKQ